MSNASTTNSRIISMDQFRGYTVAGMMVVNFLGDFAVAHPILKHHNTYFSYADSIMPAFHLAVGFALRLTLLKRIETLGKRAAYKRAIRRNLALILLSTVIVLALEAQQLPTWTELRQTGLWSSLAGPLKCQFWETLTIIGVTSIWVLPVMAASARTRIVFMAACAVLHVLLAHFFYFHFSYARPNALDPYWGAIDVRALDGGPLGFLVWSIPQLLGSLVYDLVTRRRSGRACFVLLCWSIVLMGMGYGLSCLSTLYPLTDPPAQNEDAIEVAEFPVWPGRPTPALENLESLLAEPPLVQPAAEQQRQMNYWLMCKRVVTLPFILFASGFALAVYALFILLCDMAHLQLGLFRTFGQNPLAAYIIHEIVARSVTLGTPADAPTWWVLSAFAIFFGLTYCFVRALEKRGIYLRM